MNDLSNERLMTVKEVANALNVGVRTIHDSIDRLNLAGKLKVEKVNGKITYLNEKQVTIIKLEIQKHHNLKDTKTITKAKTDLEKKQMVLQAMQYMQDEIDTLEVQVLEMKPKAEYYDAVIGSDDSVSMREAVARLNYQGWGRNKVFELLRQKNILDSKNIPYRKYQDDGYFRVIQNSYQDNQGNAHTTSTPYVYPKGIGLIKKVIDSEIKEAENE